eukprot:TRINITY_DN4846_c0_g1_i2.p1 TRINITY_DN4846_c0_g1~~TRINITY_DN4846_c0_g1_i2.p1  ORF type:complete len:337 (+),score=64.76 TRINITY_DN4846_c0_g1_i2:257-1267(+)
MTLETKVQQLSEEIRPNKKPTTDTLPKPPEKFTLKGHRGNISWLTFHPQYTQLLSSSEDTTIKIWDYETGEFERTLKGHTGSVQHVEFNKTGELMVSCSSDLTIKIWDMNSFECIKTLHGHDHNVSCAIFSPSGDKIYSSSRDKTIKIWETGTGYCVKTLTGHDEWVRKIIINEDGTLLASCSQDQTAKIWNLVKGEAIKTLRGHTHVVECITFAPFQSYQYITEEKIQDKSARFVATGSRDKTIKIWDINTGSCVKELKGHDNWVRSVQFHPEGKYLLSCSDDKTIKIWDIEQQRCIKTIMEAHSHFISCLSFNNNFPYMATGDVENMIKIWLCK